jgi:integrase
VQVYKILQRIAAQANTHLAPDQHITVSPHVLRHTLLDGLAEGKGVQYAKEQCGHRSDRYIWLYMKPSTQALADALA